MAQFYNIFVRIIGEVFKPMNLPIGYILPCNDVTGKYMIDTGAAVLCNAAGVAVEPPWTPTLLGIGANGTAISIVYDTDMAITDASGITVRVNDVISGNTGLASATNETIAITLNNPVVAGDLVTVTYDSGLGNIANAGAVDALSFDKVPATNSTV